MENTIVLYPSPGIGHLISMVELGKLILTHDPSFSVIVLVTTPLSTTTTTTAPYIHRVSATTPAITFQHLPATPPQPNSTASGQIEGQEFELLKLNNPKVHQALQTISTKSNLKAFIIDFFCNAAFQVSSSLSIPTYYFFTSGASGLAAFLYLPTIHSTTTKSLKDLNAYLNFPGLPPIFSSDMAGPLLDRESSIYKHFLNTATQMGKSSGIIVNTFDDLERKAIKAISDEFCTPLSSTPPIHCVGPLISSNENNGNDDECLRWLNSQPCRSVVFLCFGSMGKFKMEQLKEMAVGLENSGQRFLWVVRNPPVDDLERPILAGQEPDLDALLPEGFLGRTKGRGLVVKSWAPQVEVLSHESVGGFVTHCGWNSILEGVWAGVPMIGWPLYAEQRMNRVVLVEELKVGLGILEEESTERFVSAAELEKRVKELMDSEGGESVRRRVMKMSDAAKAAIGENGSSRVALAKLIARWK